MGRTPRKLAPALEMGRRIRSRRLALGLSQEALGERSGFHPTFVSSVERGERNVSLMTMLRLAEALKVDPASLVAGLRSVAPSPPARPHVARRHPPS
ncbi:MAG: helix-turn-helix domain-containing protein [Actinobacteria bacterium]|nr:helix-turn-helix domain-containing protein [Actinomycetota bacterium]